MSEQISPQSQGFTTAQVEEALRYWPNLRLGRAGEATVMAEDFEVQGKRVFFDGDECIDPYPVAMMRFLQSPVPEQQRQLWMQETEGGEWFLVFTRDSPLEPVRNPTLDEMTS